MKEVDLTEREDMSIAVMNLISLEEHLAFSAMKTGKDIFLDVLDEVRKLRIDLLKKLLINTEGEVWCISKHLLATTMRLMELSNRNIKKDKKRAAELTKNALDLYSLFWFLQKIGEGNVVKEHSKKDRKAKK